MPKKGSDDGLNMHPRAVAKREKEAQQAAQSAAAKRAALEDAKWADSGTKKDQRAAEREREKLQKQQEQEQKRLAKKQAQEQDEMLMSKVKLEKGAKKNLRELGEYPGGKVTQFELAQRKEKEEKLRQEQAKEEKLKQEKILTRDFLAIENTNHQLKMEIAEDESRYGAGNVVVARDIDSAIKGMSLLSISGADIKSDKFPEKRRKAAYKDFEKRRLPELRLDYPELKLSQLKEKIFKEFQTSPENPMNQQ